MRELPAAFKRCVLRGKNAVEGVYDGDPRQDPTAQFIPELTHLEAIERGLKVMDTTTLSCFSLKASCQPAVLVPCVPGPKSPLPSEARTTR